MRARQVSPTRHAHRHTADGDDPLTGYLTDPTTTKGDLIARGAAALARLAVGAAGTVLAADASTATGLAWATPKVDIGCDDIPTILATSASTHYERHQDRPSVIILKPLRVPVIAVADAVASPPAGMAWTNSGNITSAAIASSKLSLVAKVGTATDWNGITTTAPLIGRTYQRRIIQPYGPLVFGPVRVSSASSLANDRWAGIMVRKSGSTTVYGRHQVGWNAGGNKVYSESKGAGTTVTGPGAIGSGLAAGVWLMLVVHRGSITSYYSLAASAPSTLAGWTVHQSESGPFAASDTTLEGCLFLHTSSDLATAFTADFESFDDRWMRDADVYSPYVEWNVTPCFGYATTGETVKLIASYDAGMPWLPSQARMRLLLADAINRMPGDAATWTFGVTSSASANPAAPTTLQAAASVELKLAGTDTVTTTAARYWAVHARCASSGGTQSGSIDTALVRFVG